MKLKNRVKVFADNMANNYGMAWDVGLGAGGALMAALLFVGLFAASIKLFHISENSIPVVNEVAKAVCMLIAAFLAVLQRPNKGWLKGGIAGGLYVILSFMVFSIIDGDWTISWLILSDLVMGMVVGGIGGIIMVNLKRKK